MVDIRTRGGDLDNRRLAAGGQLTPDAQDPYLLGVAEHDPAAARAAGHRRRSVDPVPLSCDTGDHLRVRHPHPLRDPDAEVPCRASGGLGRQTSPTAPGAAGDSPGAAAPPVRDATRIAQAGLLT